MMQLALPLARRTDPETSHEAAARAAQFQCRHIALIYCALKDHGPMNKDGIARRTGLDAVAVARRGKEMERAGLVAIGPDKLDGSRLWRVLAE